MLIQIRLCCYSHRRTCCVHAKPSLRKIFFHNTADRGGGGWYDKLLDDCCCRFCRISGARPHNTGFNTLDIKFSKKLFWIKKIFFRISLNLFPGLQWAIMNVMVQKMVLVPQRCKIFINGNLDLSSIKGLQHYLANILLKSKVYPKKYAHGFCFAVLCCGYTLTDFPISIRLTSLALWQSNDCPSASKATLMNMDKYFMWIHFERLHNHNKAKHNKTVCIFLGINCNSS